MTTLRGFLILSLLVALLLIILLPHFVFPDFYPFSLKFKQTVLKLLVALLLATWIAVLGRGVLLFPRNAAGGSAIVFDPLYTCMSLRL